MTSTNGMTKDKTPPNSDDAKAERARSRRIGAKLRQLYDDVTQEEVPDDFLKLLEEADDRDEKK